MALVNMRKLSLIGLIENRKELLRVLSKARCVEVKCVEENEELSSLSLDFDRDLVNSKIASISSVLDIFKEYSKSISKYKEDMEKIKKLPVSTIEKITSQPLHLLVDKTIQVEKLEPPKSEKESAFDTYTFGKNPLVVIDNYAQIKEFSIKKKSLFASPTRISYDVFENIINKENELNEIQNRLFYYVQEINEIKAKSAKIEALIEQLKPYLTVDIPFSEFKDSNKVAIDLGVIPNNKRNLLDEVMANMPEVFFSLYENGKYTAIASVCHKSMKEQVYNNLIPLDYTKCPFDYDVTAEEKCDELQKELFNNNSLIFNKSLEIVSYKTFEDDFKTLFDYYSLEKSKLDASDKMGATGKTFILEAWIPDEREEIIKKIIDDLNYTVAYEFNDAREDEVMPTLTKNNAVVAPYEAVTNMYSIPNAREIDPNPFVAIFFFLFFGIMVSDAGYGIILTLIATAGILIKKPKREYGEGKMLYIILMGGISTIFWGIMFGGYFGITFKPVLFEPLLNPLPMLILSLVMGIIQIMFGMGVQAAAYFKQGKPLDAILEVFTWYAVFIGLGLFAGSGFLKIPAFKTIGLVILLVGVAGLFIAGGRKKKGVGKVIGGFGKLYGIVNIMSDVLSYSRLFGLGLATGVVGMVINQIAMVMIDMIPVIGYVISIAILLIGHTFNIAINTLGAYVHNCRLQYIEFFSRFYTGAGHQFVPLAGNIKYTKFE